MKNFYNLKLIYIFLALLTLLPGLIQTVTISALSESDLRSIYGDHVYYSDVDADTSIGGDGGCISPLLPSIQNEAGFAAAIDQYINKLSPSSPLNGLGADFVKAGAQYGVNPAWVVNIARKESSFGKYIPVGSANSYGRTATPSQPNVSSNDRLWYKYDSFAQSTYGQSEYLKQVYIDMNLVTITDVTHKYAPSTENDTEQYIKQMEQWIGEVFALASDSVDCSTVSSGDGTVSSDGGLIYPPNLGAANSEGYYQMPVPQNGEYIFNGGTPVGQRCASRELISIAYTLSVKWKSAYPGSLILVGDLNATGHKSHRNGVDWDIFTSDRSGANVKGNTEKSIQLGKWLAETGLVKEVYYNDSVVQKAVNDYAKQKGLPMNMFSQPGHEDHFHLRIQDRFRGTASESCK